MPSAFFYVGLPYAALALLVGGTVWRFKRDRFTITSLSSQVLEARTLAFGSLPWHVGILVVFVGHLIPFLVPELWQAVTANPAVLIGVEIVGLGAAVLAALGLGVLLTRRLLNARIQAVTSTMDLVILLLLMVQVLLGIVVAITAPYGAAWSAGTLMPYVRGLFTLSPDAALVAEMPAVIKAHVVLAFVTLALVPFTRLVHALVVPIHYLFRLPQRVVWASIRRAEELDNQPGGDPAEGRRDLVKGALGLAGAGVLLAAGVLDKLVRFVKGDAMSKDQKEHHMAQKLGRLEQTASQRALELERMRSETITVAKLSELQPKSGKYFIDYQMRPALAFQDEKGLPILISAKCTHLGCTVGSQADDQGRILCPCHISYFDIKTGRPNDGAPAKEPLPRLGWVIRDAKGKVLASRSADGTVEGSVDPKAPDAASYEVCIAKKYEEA